MTPSRLKQELTPATPTLPIAVVDARPAANDDSATVVTNDLRNPLWIIAIGMAWFFGITAAIIALT
jgi:hypothetical protein